MIFARALLKISITYLIMINWDVIDKNMTISFVSEEEETSK